jgi:hypothetical protein
MSHFLPHFLIAATIPQASPRHEVALPDASVHGVSSHISCLRKSGVPAENNHHIVIGKENYFLSADGHLMPTRKDRRRI